MSIQDFGGAGGLGGIGGVGGTPGPASSMGSLETKARAALRQNPSRPNMNQSPHQLSKETLTAIKYLRPKTKPADKRKDPSKLMQSDPSAQELGAQAALNRYLYGS